jgi:hypothetical protein
MLFKHSAYELVSDMKLRRKILEPVLFGYVWVYGPMDMTEARWGKMVFLANGRTFGYGHPNEHGWDFSNDVFRLLRKDREPTSIYDEAFTEYGRLLLKGRPLENPDSLYCLRQVDYTDD